MNVDEVQNADREIEELMQKQAGRQTKDDKKALAKALKKKEKAEKKAQDEYNREVRRAREEKRLEEERKRDEEKQREREEEEQRIREIEEEKRKQEEEEYMKWVDQITLDDEGFDAKESFCDNASKMEEFLQSLKSKRITVVEEIAEEFGISQQEVFEAVSKLEMAGKVTIIVDDRGKMLYVSEEELKEIAGRMNEEGRVSLGKLTQICGDILHTH